MSNETYKNDIKATMLNQLFRILAGPILLLFIPLYLTSVEQGYWYTFTSIAALAIFADLGFSNIVLQFAAHEFAFLQFDENHIIYGKKDNLWKLASFFRFTVKWLLKVTCLVFPFIIVGGYFFLNNRDNQINWHGAWVIYSLASALTFFNSILLSFFEGCNSVTLLQKMRFKISLCNSFIAILSLFLGFNLFSLSFSLLFSTIVGSLLILKEFKLTIMQLWRMSKNKVYNWKQQFFPLIWRYAISWCSGYFIFQLFTPIAFKFYGAEFSGKVGLSIAMWTAGFGIAMSWVNAVIPRINILIEKREWNLLDLIFKRSLQKAMFTMIIGGTIFLLIYYLLQDKVFFFKRILSIKEMMVLFICWIGQVYINSLAIYLRSHKKEPLMFISVIVAVYVGITTYLCAIYLPSGYYMLGFMSSLIFWIPVVHKIYLKEKNTHKDILEVRHEI